MHGNNSNHNQGSPPRVRGKVDCQCGNVRFWRITPACAGKSFYLNGLTACFEDHPRVCGEKPQIEILRVTEIGSPPRVRGKALFIFLFIHILRITPACAGKSRTRTTANTANGDHPRVCGEKLCLYPLHSCKLGSPPRVRGKETKIHLISPVQGITPACAGKSK